MTTTAASRHPHPHPGFSAGCVSGGSSVLSKVKAVSMPRIMPHAGGSVNG